MAREAASKSYSDYVSDHREDAMESVRHEAREVAKAGLRRGVQREAARPAERVTLQLRGWENLKLPAPLHIMKMNPTAYRPLRRRPGEIAGAASSEVACAA